MNARAKRFLNAAQAQWGAGWHLLPDSLRAAVVCREIVRALTGQDDQILRRNPALQRLADDADAVLATLEARLIAPVKPKRERLTVHTKYGPRVCRGPAVDSCACPSVIAPCPYDADVNNDPKSSCACCDACRAQCAADI